MIFITVGSQKFQFDRLLKEVDRLIETGKMNGSEIVAQTGYCQYEPKHFQFEQFMSKDDFLTHINNSEIVITHGGTGSIINSVKLGKKVIGVPRQEAFGEHVDNHQFEIIEEFENTKLIYAVYEIADLEDALAKVVNMTFRTYQSNTNHIIELLETALHT
ncbi:PssE/Cps14G family polysaccharide biosynthesis glycosyltransferase [Peribacillus sp. FSL H8-0477]|uniref:PssE/Cps14G family polysaccharide biosynthesis glycosyltransferase n=1 Tax=Peribacillus sp. FSL H8-0477 TaxID=2921388 RepID=UPI0030F9DAF6